MSGDQIRLQINYRGEAIVIDDLQPENTVLDLKIELCKRTNVLPENQKIIGFRPCTKVAVNDSTTLSSFSLKPNTKLMLVGSTQEAISEVNKITECPDVGDECDVKEDLGESQLPENIQKINRRCKAYRPRKLAEFRDGHKLLVLDIDYTIFDHMTPAESVHQLARPYLKEFLTRAYVYYDICIWSATSLTWILAKLGQLGLIPQHVAKNFQYQYRSSEDFSELANNLIQNSETTEASQPFKIALILDSTDMISVNFSGSGVKEVKPLAVIWNNHSQWGPHNTIMFDDVRRNFIMNPQSGLRIRSYRDAHVNNTRDRELVQLARYLELIALREPDFTRLNHSYWERYVRKYGHYGLGNKVYRQIMKDNKNPSNLSLSSTNSIVRNQISQPNIDTIDDQSHIFEPSKNSVQNQNMDDNNEIKKEEEDSIDKKGEELDENEQNIPNLETLK